MLKRFPFLKGIKYYYRLKQVDINEKFRHSEIRAASLNESNGYAIQLWPNPVEKMLQVTFDGTIETGKVLIKITDARGAVIMQKSHDLNTNQKAELNVVTLANGQYILSVENNKGLLYAKPFLKK
jgi:methionine-rich copper-binding protein CopC